MDESQETQNVSVDDSSQSQSNSIDDLFGEQSAQPEVKQEAEISKETKKEQDFEKAFFKTQAELKALKAEKAAATTVAPAEVDYDNDPGVKVLEKIVQRAMDPYVGSFKEQQEAKVIDGFKQQKYVNELSPQINEEFKKLDESMPLADRLETARRNAIANNIDLITDLALKVGQDEGLKSKTFKQSQGILKESPARGQVSDNLAERLEKGEVPMDEYKERYDEIQEIYKQG